MAVKGYRNPGSGIKKGQKHKNTLTKELGRELVRKMVLEQLGPMTQAQITRALGMRHTFLRDEGGRFVMLTDPKQIEAALNSGEEGKYYWTFSKEPCQQSYRDLCDRALDKAADQEQAVKVSGVLKIKHELPD